MYHLSYLSVCLSICLWYWWLNVLVGTLSLSYIPFTHFWLYKNTFGFNFFLWSIILPTAQKGNSTSSKIWYVCVVCAIVHICTHVCRSHRLTQVLLLRDHPPCLLRLSLSLASCSPNWPGKLASNLQGPACLCPHKNGIASMYLPSQHFSMGSGDPTLVFTLVRWTLFWTSYHPSHPKRTYTRLMKN